jgi:universal stress protein A
MFSRLLVPVDLSDRNARPLRLALALARASRARVILLHVVEQLAATPPAELAAFYGRLLQRAQRRLEVLANPFARAGIPVRTEVSIGQPAREIVRTATRHKVDLLVMASHRVRVNRPGLAWGTISYKVGIFCRCPILLIK